MSHEPAPKRRSARSRHPASAWRSGPTAVTLLSIAIAAGGGGSRATPVAAQAPPGTYQLVDTWSDRRPAPRAGMIGQALDLSSTASGERFVLDADPPALHAFSSEGQPRSLRLLPTGVTGLRVDAGPESQTVWVLGRDALGFRLDALQPDGRFAGPVRPPAVPGQDYVDIAADRQGRLWLVTGNAQASQDGLEGPRLIQLGADGALRSSIRLRERFLPGCERLEARAVTVGVDDRLRLALARDDGACPDPGATEPSPGDTRPPLIDGVITLQPQGVDLVITALQPMASPDDLSAGPQAILVAAGSSVTALESGSPRLSLDEPEWPGPERLDWPSPRFRIDADAQGGLSIASVGCPLPGLYRVDDQDPSRLSPFGVLAQPTLDGPRLPLRLAALDTVDLLRGPLDRSGRFSPGQTPPAWQTWSGAGEGLDQIALCTDALVAGSALGSAPTLARQAIDIARDRSRRFAIAPSLAGAWSGPAGPDWIHVDPTARFIAGAADLGQSREAGIGRLALLDAASREVRVLGPDGQVETRWPLAIGRQAALPVDLALVGRRVYLADLGRSQVEVRDLGGALQGAFAVHDGPRAIAAGGDGSLYVLGRDDIGLRYDPDGRILASWPLPEQAGQAGLTPLDIAVDADQRVYVSYARFAPAGPDRDFNALPVLDSGLWVFEPLSEAPPVPPSGAGESCALRAVASARPARLPLGAETELQLAVEGRCPGWYAPQHLAIALAAGDAAAQEAALERAQAVLLGFLGSLDVDNLWLGLASYVDGQPADLPLTHDIDPLRARIASAGPEGQPSLAEAVGRARAILADPPVLPDARRTLLVVLTGAENEAGLATALEAARADGIDLVLLAFPAAGQPDPVRLAQLAPQPGDRFVDLPPVGLAPLIERATGWQSERRLLEWARLQVSLPATMRYVTGSAVPAASYDPVAHRLDWDLGPQPARPGLQLRFRLIPLAEGRWPTLSEARSSSLDSYGSLASLGFNRPQVEVYLPSGPPPPQPIYLPFALRAACVPATLPLDIVLLLDVSSSMAEPSGDGGSKLDAARSAAGTLLSLLRLPRDRVAVLAFDGSARRAIGLSADRAAVEAALASLEPGQGTRIDLGLLEAGAVLADAPRPEARRTVILLTDGLQSGPSEPVFAAAADIKAGGASLFALGLGDDVDRAMLRALASSPAAFLVSPSAAQLAGLYQDILAAIDCGG